jgi:hypothetical protein
MSRSLSDGTREQIGRTCRATLGDELRHVRYVTRDHRECLYEREDVLPETDVELKLRLGDHDPDVDFDTYHVVIFANETECTVFIGESNAPLRRCDPESVADFGEVGAAISAILGADRP